MKKEFYEFKQASFQEREKERNKISKMFVKKYGDPALFHAVDKKENFIKILNEGKIKLPKEHKQQKKFPYMENILKVDNSIFLSLGPVYYIDYGLKNSLIFDIELLKESEFYKRPLPFKCYRKIVDYWYENDKAYLNNVMRSSEKLNNIIGYYIDQVESNAKVRPLRYWQAEKEFYDAIMKYPKKDKLIKMAKKMQESLLIKWPYSKRTARQKYLRNDCPEIIYPKNINLLERPSFLGFFIAGKIPREIKDILKKKYKGKILFDGRSIEVIE